MKIIIHIDKEGQTIDAAVHDVFVESADVVRIRRENEKLLVDSVVLDKIIKVVDGFDHNPDACMEDICEIIDERGDLNE